MLSEVSFSLTVQSIWANCLQLPARKRFGECQLINQRELLVRCVWVNAVLQPEFFVEISEELAKEKGIQNAGWVRVWSKRGEVRAKALVTKRIRPLVCDGKTVHVVGVPLHWGLFMGQAKKGFGPNSLTPVVGDANSETPEFKAFLVNIEPAPGPVA